MLLPSRPFFILAAFLLLAAPSWSAPKIGLLLRGRTAFWVDAEKGARAAAEKLGVEILVKAPASEVDVSVQIQMLNALAAQGITALVIAPCNQQALSAPVAALAAKGVKIVVIDSKLERMDSHVFVAADNFAAGKDAGEFLARLVQGDDEVCILRHSQNGGAPKEREAGAIEAFRHIHPRANLHADIYANAELGAETEKARLLLATYPKTKAILASSTVATVTMLRVLREKKQADPIKLVGFGFNLNPEVAAAIEANELAGWISQFPHDMGGQGIAAAVALLDGKTLDRFIPIKYLMVTKANLHTPEVQALLGL